MSYGGEIYFPVLIKYHPTEFNRHDMMVMDYRSLSLGNDDWILWAPNPWDPFESNNAVDVFPSPPSSENLLGTDDRGRDVLARLLYGFRYSMFFALGLWILSYVIGTFAGALMGYFGGKTDLLGQRIVEVFESVPVFLLLLTLISIFAPSVGLLILFNTVFGWMFISIYVRAEFLRLRRREYVEAARALGASTGRIIFKHILPNAMGPLITFSPFSVAGNISALAALDYLGFGLQPPTPSWGELLGQAQKYFVVAWWLAVFTSIVLFLTLVMLNFIGNGVRDAYDPRKG
jgi:microcin C transport system permease protein